jgi:hypothetical protein
VAGTSRGSRHGHGEAGLRNRLCGRVKGAFAADSPTRVGV